MKTFHNLIYDYESLGNTKTVQTIKKYEKLPL